MNVLHSEENNSMRLLVIAVVIVSIVAIIVFGVLVLGGNDTSPPSSITNSESIEEVNGHDLATSVIQERWDGFSSDQQLNACEAWDNGRRELSINMFVEDVDFNSDEFLTSGVTAIVFENAIVTFYITNC